MLKNKTITTLTILVMAALIALNIHATIPWLILIGIGVLWLIITACGSFFIQWNYHITALHSNPKTINNNIAITFDDGPHPIYTPQILDLLKQHQSKATFFIIGKHAKEHPSLIQRILNEGHLIGNHTYSHSTAFGFFSSKKVIAELRQTNHIIESITGIKMNLYRPAFGVTNPMIKRAVKHLNLTAIGWNVRSLDTTARSKKTILHRITKALKKGDVILLHDTDKKTVTVLEQLLLFLQEKNLKSVTVDQLLEIEAYA